MAKNATLNPASMPFFPGLKHGDRVDGSGLGFGGQHGLDRYSISSMSTTSINDYRSARSSPSPTQQRQEEHREQSPVSVQSGRSPTVRQVDTTRPYSATDNRNGREGSVLGVMSTLPENEDVNFAGWDFRTATQPPRSSFNSPAQDIRNQSPPVPATGQAGQPSWGPSSFNSVSPVSSLGSGSQLIVGLDNQLDAQLKSSPVISDILRRLVECESSNRQIQTDLSSLHLKVNLLVQQAMASAHSQPEFKDPFASSTIPSTPNGHESMLALGHRASIGNIAPNQSVPPDDSASISQRLQILTSSVSQLLAIQTAQIPQARFDGGRKSTAGLIPPIEVAPHQVVPTGNGNSPFLGHGMPNRADLRPMPRHPNPPMRTWSAGTLDLPIRNMEHGGPRPDASLGAKRRSVSGVLRRDSSGLIDGQGDSPIVTKWEQLSLSPELLRSLTKFGIGPPNKIQQRALPFLLRGADIIAQAPPTQERIAAYVIPAIQVAVTHLHITNRGPFSIILTTTVDQATQAQRMVRDIGGPIGVRSALGVGTTSANSDLSHELRLLQQNMPHILCGTPQKLHALFTTSGGLNGADVRFLVLDEVDQLIARNLHEFVFNIVKLLPPPRSRSPSTSTPSNGLGLPPPTFTSPFDQSSNGNGRRFSAAAPSPGPLDASPLSIERQTALFSNTVPQDVLNLASAINLREPVRVLVRRDGNVSSSEPTQGSRGLRQFYLYLAFTASGRSDSVVSNGGLGIIGSGRGATNAETTQAREWKLEALADLFDDIESNQVIVHVGGMAALDAVVYKLAARGVEAIPLHGEMNAGTKLAALNKFRAPGPSIVTRHATKALIVYDVQVKPPEVPHVPLIINYDLPKAVEEYSHRVVAAIAPNYSRAGVVINFVTATGGDVEMLRSIECFYKIKCPEVPMSLRDIL
ncbi:hypothetical protein FA15DRAFT_664859 [Coprinopsis marcescibilis]|uniref:RNA helicase n=1 Tax=Coprinopsis marcescibilis TaxID=230819 RepID=A0A5C3L7S2_COPMA|nr:hypothetical protein FA15DRAFT_664859 [Coprinopsis marcescibilis]